MTRDLSTERPIVLILVAVRSQNIPMPASKINFNATLVNAGRSHQGSSPSFALCALSRAALLEMGFFYLISR